MKVSSLIRNEKGEKWCSYQRHWMPVAIFSRDKSNADGLNSRCKDCDHIRRGCPKQNQFPEGFRQGQEGFNFANRLRQAYNIEVSEYWELVRLQAGCCWWCLEQFEEEDAMGFRHSGSMMVDHWRGETGIGAVKGIAHHRCNIKSPSTRKDMLRHRDACNRALGMME